MLMELSPLGLDIRLSNSTLFPKTYFQLLEKKMKKKEEDLERVKREDRGIRRRQSNQERLRERLLVRFEDD